MSQDIILRSNSEVFLSYFLPEGMLDYFEPIKAEDHIYIQPQTKKRIPALHLFFDEKDNRTDKTRDYTPKGFGKEVVINDFPAREKKLVLHVLRRRWITPEGKTQYLDLYAKMTADGTKFSEEFASFLKKIWIRCP